MTKIGAKRIHVVRVRGGNTKFRALRLETGNFSWATNAIAKKCRIIRVVYNATNNELVRTNTLVKSSIVEIDATPFRQWYESHFATPIGKKKKTADGVEVEAVEEVKKSNHVQRTIVSRKAGLVMDPHLEEQFSTGRLLARLSSRPGQSGRADGVIIEGKELDFYLKKIRSRKA